MPLLTFKCSKCNTVSKKLVSDDKEQLCSECQTVLIRQLPSNINSSLDGYGWARTGYETVNANEEKKVEQEYTQNVLNAEKLWEKEANVSDM